ncbi:MSMEG_0570 family nitrogen starvation response protein [Nocardioides sp.]|jgi:uncharacterized repeat protein (TIGR04042 family)|uniref:MSMEG_0570 family nitrogen starvation response protein n=1 Tax=Nocardioides sp. TaxID=35761 RepID=UPI0031FF3174|nr:hypothetical protein [Nocardioides sp.]
MPEMTFSIRWPDGRVDDCYSPSLVMHDYLDAGGCYTVHDFVERSANALQVASERVRERLGFACTSAAATVEQIQRSATSYRPNDLVEVLAMHPSLPISTRESA